MDLSIDELIACWHSTARDANQAHYPKRNSGSTDFLRTFDIGEHTGAPTYTVTYSTYISDRTSSFKKSATLAALVETIAEHQKPLATRRLDIVYKYNIQHGQCEGNLKCH
jgi:hypothetical protein